MIKTDNREIKNILYVATCDIDDSTYGGAVACKRNYISLKKCANIIRYNIYKKSNFKSLLSVIFGFYPPTFSDDLVKIEDVCRRENINAVFFEGSQFGRIVKSVSNKGYATIVFFHNCEKDYNSVRFGSAFSLKKWIYGLLVERNEKYACQYGDMKLCLTDRDKEHVERYYNTSIYGVSPLTIVDRVKKDMSLISENSNKYCLLCGPTTTPNVEGFAWFVENVSPYISCDTIVIGKGFEKYKEKWNSEKVHVIGYVETVDEYYINASISAIPLLSGSGMKIKTAEALMYGKYVLGTPEAFVGYNINPEVGLICETADEYIVNINHYLNCNKEKYNTASRQLFLEKYDSNSSLPVFKEIVEMV